MVKFSNVRSWKGFRLGRFLWGRVRNLFIKIFENPKDITNYRRLFLTVVTSLCCYYALDGELASLLAGPIAESVWSLGEFYFKKVRLN